MKSHSLQFIISGTSVCCAGLLGVMLLVTTLRLEPQFISGRITSDFKCDFKSDFLIKRIDVTAGIHVGQLATLIQSTADCSSNMNGQQQQY